VKASFSQLNGRQGSILVNVAARQLNRDTKASFIDGRGAKLNVSISFPSLLHRIDSPLFWPGTVVTACGTNRSSRLKPVRKGTVIGRIADREDEGFIPKSVKFLIGVGPEEQIITAAIVGLAAAEPWICNRNGMSEI